ncbi:hypothetical protein [Streptomyces sp. KR80]|uniref:hypothetical protein n=1 Tax=Streptomyces sp. KR80 TaxID=3457426 RepID=UPI003FCFECE3
MGAARVFAELEEMTTFVGQGQTEDSPDLLDSMVWALWDLFLDPTMPPPCGGDDQRLSGRREGPPAAPVRNEISTCSTASR